MPITLYHWAPSAPSRCTYLALKTLDLDFEVKEVDVSSRKQNSLSFRAANPHYVVPTLDDNGFRLWESRAIVGYLVDKYAKNDVLYPKELQQRAIINQRLNFDATLLYPAVRDICHAVIYDGKKKIPEELEISLHNALLYLDYFLSFDDFTCGNSLTIADISLFATVTSAQAIKWDLSRYEFIERWLRRCSYKIQGVEENDRGCNMFADVFLSTTQPKKK